MTNYQTHHFIFHPGVWIGEGKITFSTSPESLHFYTKWVVDKQKEKIGYICQQSVEILGIDEQVSNQLTFFEMAPASFSVRLENELIGSVSGKGVIDAKIIAWEYPLSNDFEGFEVYELQENGDYLLRAEYNSSDQYRTIIEGKIWKKFT
ncbi:Uncharacterized protein NEOC65_002213 [Neochlamydia sp. AcF65]|uniref:hypothetical protein n=1 Tax=Neochlamydia sp. AcF65 TaxID=2795735 RepID=UPI001BC99129|nr:hypothetical protein [Neochlamydia sp. AcF65]MBS4167107.1 Uncharacterized protein [Neochlamydia sp. AcF65]